MRASLFPLAAVLIALGCSSSSADSSPRVIPPPDAGNDDSSDGSVVDAGPDVPTPPDPPLRCPVTIPVDTLADKRGQCTFAAGAKVTDTLGVPKDVPSQLPIRHVIVLMKENRAFDHLLFKLHDLQPDVEAVPDSFANDDTTGASIKAFHATTTCIQYDPNHQWTAMHNSIDGGKMDGFVKSAAVTTGTDGHFAISHYEQSDVPFYYWLASTWSIDDRHFSAARSGTSPNRLFMYLGTNDGVRSTDLTYPDPATPTLFDTLDKAAFSWGVYSDGELLSGTLNWDSSHRGAHTFADFLSALDAGTLPNVSFVDARDTVEDEHPTADVQVGEAWTRNVYEHLVKSPQWLRTAMIWTYDEGGGFADHVPPPEKACVARPGNPKDAPYFELGVRVPFAVISPYARPHHVSHVVADHTAITRFIETVFDLPALTSRDGNSDALLDMFDFTTCPPPMATPPGAVPEAGTKGCSRG